MIERLAIVGSGNVGSHLGHAFLNAEKEICGVWSRSPQNARSLAEDLKCPQFGSISDIRNVDCAIVAVSDDAIEGIIKQLPDETFAVHTSGMTSLESISRANIGTLYPLQTFSKGKAVNMSAVPFCIECPDNQKKSELFELAASISENVVEVNSAKRKHLHLAAVFVSNFVNLMYIEGKRIAAGGGLDFELLRPLLHEVANKVEKIEPNEAQTGPAIRKDYKTINAHLDLLQNDTELREIYQKLTDRIISNHHSDT